METAYTAQAHATGAGRNGHVKSADGRVDLDMAPPKELGGSGDGANPEQLFAAGFGACFLNAVQVVARREHADARDSAVRAEVDLGTGSADGYALAVRLQVALPNVPWEQAHELIRKADAVCPYSNAVRGNIDVSIKVIETT